MCLGSCCFFTVAVLARHPRSRFTLSPSIHERTLCRKLLVCLFLFPRPPSLNSNIYLSCLRTLLCWCKLALSHCLPCAWCLVWRAGLLKSANWVAVRSQNVCPAGALLPPCMFCTYDKRVYVRVRACVCVYVVTPPPLPPQQTTNSFSQLHLLYIIRDISSHSEPITAHGGVNLIQSKATLNISLRLSTTDTSIFCASRVKIIFWSCAFSKTTLSFDDVHTQNDVDLHIIPDHGARWPLEGLRGRLWAPHLCSTGSVWRSAICKFNVDRWLLCACVFVYPCLTVRVAATAWTQTPYCHWDEVVRLPFCFPSTRRPLYIWKG